MRYFLSAVFILTFASCSYTPYVNTFGGKNATRFNKSSMKKGKACTFLGFGDRTVSKAAQNGDIENIVLVEESRCISKQCTIVYGK
jgi:hypothetical protein